MVYRRYETGLEVGWVDIPGVGYRAGEWLEMGSREGWYLVGSGNLGYHLLREVKYSESE